MKFEKLKREQTIVVLRAKHADAAVLNKMLRESDISSTIHLRLMTPGRKNGYQ